MHIGITAESWGSPKFIVGNSHSGLSSVKSVADGDKNLHFRGFGLGKVS